MKLTKRILCLALALTLIFALAACGKKNKDTNKNGTTNTTEQVTTTTTDDWAGNLEGDNLYNDGQLSWG